VFSTFTLVNSGGIDYVSQWDSIIGGASKSLTQSTSARRPIYRRSPFNGFKPCVRFYHQNSDTTNPYLDGFNIGGFGATNAQLNMFTACMQIDPTIRAATGDTTENAMGIFIYEGYPGGILLSSNASGIQTGVATGWWSNDLSVQRSVSITTISPYRRLTCSGGTVYGGTSGTWYVSTHSKGYVPQTITSTSGLNRRTYPYVNTRVGTALAGGGAYAYPFGGEIYELILITGTITLNTKVKMLEYLNAKWGP
jgi:hypothetical protein